jgi:serine/threonine-protein kinase
MNQLVGTPAYLAPELIAGREVTPAADVYGLGVLAYELLSGRRPFVADTAYALLRAHMDEEPARPDGMADTDWNLISVCLAKEPDARPDATQLIASFTTTPVAGGSGGQRAEVRDPEPEPSATRAATSPAPAQTEPPESEGRMPKWLVPGLILTLVVALAALTLWLAWSTKDRATQGEQPSDDSRAASESPTDTPTPTSSPANEYQVPITVGEEDAGVAVVALPDIDQGASGIRRYRVELKKADAGTETWTINPGKSTETVTELDPEGTYCIKVFAIAESPPPILAPEGSNCVTPDGVPDGAEASGSEQPDSGGS